MNSLQTFQYTLRRIPGNVDMTLRHRAKREGKSLNEVVLEVLKGATQPRDVPVVHHDMDDLIGTWTDDPACDKALKHQRRVDPKLWG